MHSVSPSNSLSAHGQYVFPRVECVPWFVTSVSVIASVTSVSLDVLVKSGVENSPVKALVVKGAAGGRISVHKAANTCLTIMFNNLNSSTQWSFIRSKQVISVATETVDGNETTTVHKKSKSISEHTCTAEYANCSENNQTLENFQKSFGIHLLFQK